MSCPNSEPFPWLARVRLVSVVTIIQTRRASINRKRSQHRAIMFREDAASARLTALHSLASIITNWAPGRLGIDHVAREEN